jgi:hypothetical protein
MTCVWSVAGSMVPYARQRPRQTRRVIGGGTECLLEVCRMALEVVTISLRCCVSGLAASRTIAMGGCQR